MFNATPTFQHAMLKTEWLETSSYDDHISEGSFHSGGQQILTQEHNRLSQYTPPTSPQIYYSSRPPASMRPHSQHLVPGTSQFSAYSSLKGHRRAASAGQLSTVPSPRDTSPSTPNLSGQTSDSRPVSEIAYSHHNSPFTPQSPGDVDFSTGTHLPSPENGFHQSYQMPLFSEYCDTSMDDANPSVTSGDIFAFPFGNQEVSEDFSNPPYPDPENMANATRTVTPYVLEGYGGHSGPYHPQYLSTQDSEIHYDEASFDSEVGNNIVVTPVDDLQSGLENSLSFQESMPITSMPCSSTQILQRGALSRLVTQRQQQPHQHHVVRQSSPTESNLPSPCSPVSSPASASATATTNGSQRRQVALRVPPNTSSIHQCAHCHAAFETETRRKKHVRKEHELPYLCIFHHYGCKEVFGTKNEWVRHVRVQHLRLETWRCTLETCGERSPSAAGSPGTNPSGSDSLLPKGAKRTNDYGRKDLFQEHVKRIHKNVLKAHIQKSRSSSSISDEAIQKEFLDDLQKRARLVLRKPPPRVSCPCCPGDILWTEFDEWIEHIAKGMENDKAAFIGFTDPQLQSWMVNEGLLEWIPANGKAASKWRLQGAEGKKGGRQSTRAAASTSSLQSLFNAQKSETSGMVDDDLDASGESDSDSPEAAAPMTRTSISRRRSSQQQAPQQRRQRKESVRKSRRQAGLPTGSASPPP